MAVIKTPASGEIDAIDINLALDRGVSTTMSMNGSAERELAEVLSGQIKFSDFYDKPSAPAIVFETAPNGAGTLASPVAGDIGMLGFDGNPAALVAETSKCAQPGIKYRWLVNERMEFDLYLGHAGKKFKFTHIHEGDPLSNNYVKVFLNGTEIADITTYSFTPADHEYTIPSGTALFAIQVNRGDDSFRCFHIE